MNFELNPLLETIILCIFAVTYLDFFWADRYTHRTYEVTTVVGVEQVFLNVCLQIL